MHTQMQTLEKFWDTKSNCETDGTLQHGPSVAREMGKPCIVGIEDITKIIKDDQTVELDGATGTIKILTF